MTDAAGVGVADSARPRLSARAAAGAGDIILGRVCEDPTTSRADPSILNIGRIFDGLNAEAFSEPVKVDRIDGVLRAHKKAVPGKDGFEWG